MYEENDLGQQHGLLSNLLLLQLAVQVQQAEEAQAMHTKPLPYHCICLLLNHQAKLVCYASCCLLFLHSKCQMQILLACRLCKGAYAC